MRTKNAFSFFIPSIIIIIIIIISIPQIVQPVTIPQYNGEGPTETNIFRFEQNVHATIQAIISNDLETQLICGLFYDSDYFIICLNDQGETIYTFRNIGYYYIGEILATYDVETKTFVYIQYQNEDIPQHYVLAIDTTTGEQLYNISIGNKDALLANYGYPWIMNSDSAVYYTTNSVGTLLFAYDIITGNRVNSVIPEFTVLGMIVANDTLMIYSTSLQGPFYQYTELTILEPLSLDPICSFNNSLTVIYSDTQYYYILNNGDDFNNHYSYSLFQFNSLCEPQWRFPISNVYTSASNLFLTYDTNLNLIYLWDFYNLTQISVADATQYQVLVVNPPPPPNTYVYTFMLIGVDQLSNIYFWKQDDDQRFYYFRSYDSSLKVQLDIVLNAISDSDLSLGLLISDFSGCIGLTPQGVIFYIHTYSPNGGWDNDEPIYFVGFEMESGFNWQVLSILSILVLILSFIVSIGLMLKHLIMGDDPKGWNKRKLPDVLGLFVTSAALIFVTFAVCYAQIDLIEVINENTTMFSLNIEEFVSLYVQSCSNPTLPPPSTVDLCTCYQSADAISYQLSSCKPDSCSNEVKTVCNILLADSCDCVDSLYQWTCECDYNLNGTCSSNVTSASNPNPYIDSLWNDCRKSFDVPTMILNISFYVVIVCTLIILLMNIIQLLFKLDSGVVEFIATLLSIVFASLQFFLLIFGNSYLENGCIEGVMKALPGCSLVYSTDNVLNMQTTALAYLSNAYLNLLSPPIMFIISAIPDVLSLFICLKGVDCRRNSSSSRHGFEAF